ncbi:BTAD domain-containing putative transcriptional regulator [Kribbella sp. DT2]|uniref:AfsR/SARP family transcriptional regulator n=1 Tax=Kribbella sp. DT2 TaxID=3393427 RepID=UPI003CE6A255
MEFSLLGPLRVSSSGQDVPIRPGRRRTLLALLLLKANSVVATDELVERLWDAAPPAKAKAALQVQMARLRRELGTTDPIRTVPSGYCLETLPGEVDVERFESLVGAAPGVPDAADRSRVLTDALALWRGPALIDVPGDLLHRDVVPPLNERRSQALELRIDADLELGRQAALIPELRGLTGEHPLRERFWAQLMIAYYRAEQRVEALETYRTARQVLVDALGVEPGPELRRLERDILVGVPELGPDRPAPRLDDWEPQYQLPREVTGVVGRDDVVAELVGRLTGDEPVPVAAIHGVAGGGKSTLAVRVAHRVRSAFPDGQWFVRLDGADGGGRAAADVLGELLLASGISGTGIPRGVSSRGAMLRARLAGRRVLLLLDDAAGAEHVEDMIPGTEGSAVLVTSRRDLSGLSVRHGSHGLELPVLDVEASTALLGVVLGEERVAAEPEAVAELVDLCAQLPLALRIAAASLGLHPNRSISGYVDELRGSDRLSRLQVAGDTAVRAAFDLSYRGLDPVAARTFRLLGVVPGVDFTAETVAVLLDTGRTEAQRALDALATTSLIHHQSPGRYQFHDLLRLYAAEQSQLVEGPEQCAAVFERLVRYQVARVDQAVGLLYPAVRRLERPAPEVPEFAGHGDALAWLDAERVNLVAAARQAVLQGPAELTWYLSDALRGYFAARRHNDDWENLAISALGVAEEAGTVEAQAALHLSLGVLHSYRAEHRAAETQYQLAIALRQEAGTGDKAGPIYNNLGVLYTSQARYAEAVETFRRGIALDRRLSAPSSLANKLSNLATVLFYIGDLNGAVEQLHEAEDVRSAAGIHPAPHTPFTLGQCLHRLGHLDAAATALGRALEIGQEIGEELAVIYARYGLAELLCDRDELGAAAEHAAAALALAREIHSPAAEIDALNVSGTVQWLQGEHLSSVALHTRALELSGDAAERRTGVIARTGLARALLDSGQETAALRHATGALEAARRHGLLISEARALALLTRLYRDGGNHALATTSAKAAAALHRRTGYRPPVWEAAWLVTD